MSQSSNFIATQKRKESCLVPKDSPLIADEHNTFVPHALSFRIFADYP
jgi:hypothetical protein